MSSPCTDVKGSFHDLGYIIWDIFFSFKEVGFTIINVGPISDRILFWEEHL